MTRPTTRPGNHREVVLAALDDAYNEAIDFGYIKADRHVSVSGAINTAHRNGYNEALRDVERRIEGLK